MGVRMMRIGGDHHPWRQNDTTTPQCNIEDAAAVSVVTRAFNNVRRDRTSANNESKAWPNLDEEIDER